MTSCFRNNVSRLRAQEFFLREQNVSEKNSETLFVCRKQKKLPQQMLRVPAKGSTFRAAMSATMLPRLRDLVTNVARNIARNIS